jgi:putative heme transporter
VVRVRFQALGSVRDHWASLTGIVLLKESATFLALLTSLRALGAEQVELTFLEVFAVYAVVRLASMVEITPGGVGVVETLYIGALMWASDGQDEATIVAAVFVFRIFTYLLPILVGGICWLILSRHFRRTGATLRPSEPAAPT